MARTDGTPRSAQSPPDVMQGHLSSALRSSAKDNRIIFFGANLARRRSRALTSRLPPTHWKGSDSTNLGIPRHRPSTRPPGVRLAAQLLVPLDLCLSRSVVLRPHSRGAATAPAPLAVASERIGAVERLREDAVEVDGWHR